MHTIHLIYKLIGGKNLENCTSDTPLEVCQARDETANSMKTVSTPKLNRRNDTTGNKNAVKQSFYTPCRLVAF